MTSSTAIRRQVPVTDYLRLQARYAHLFRPQENTESCGNCFGCDNCYGICPDNAIIKLGDGQYEIDYDYCKGCGLCAAECPCGAIQMQPEPT